MVAPRKKSERTKLIKRLYEHGVIHKAQMTSEVVPTGKSEESFKSNLKSIELQRLLNYRIGVNDCSTPFKFDRV
jgi:hypothetical protein